MDFSGRTAIVTGGAGGIGSAVAAKLAAGGAHVAVADLQGDAAERVAGRIASAGGGRVIGVAVDVTSTASIAAMVATVERELGPVDVLINNAGWDVIGWFVESDEAQWDKVIAINLRGQIACTHAVLKGMIERKRGRIVCVASDAGRVGSSGEVVYSAAKGGVIAFSKAVAREVARHGICVNTIAPGPTETPFLDVFGAQSEKILEGMKRATPLRRLAQPAEVAEAIAFMASPAAGFITGQTLSVSGGLTML